MVYKLSNNNVYILRAIIGKKIAFNNYYKERNYDLQVIIRKKKKLAFYQLSSKKNLNILQVIIEKKLAFYKLSLKKTLVFCK